MLNALSIDVEDYFQVSAFEGVVHPGDWPDYETRVVKNTRRILGILAEHSVRATFFFLGWVAERHPDLVQRVREQGHEIATHGYGHRLVSEQGPDEFRRDVEGSLRVLEDVTGERVWGYRAPSYSITPQTEWALDILQEQGLRYDSSLFSIPHDLGGFPGSPRSPFQIRDDLWEIPLTTWSIWKWRVPVAGGGYLRLYPYSVTHRAIRSVNQDGIPAVVYVHPWEFDPEQPRIPGAPLKSRFRHYQNLNKTEPKFRALCRDFEFAPLRQVLENWLAKDSGSEPASDDGNDELVDSGL